MNVCAKCGFENNANAKKCANCLTDLHWAKVNLGKFHGNADDTRRIGIESWKERGLPLPEDEFTPFEAIQVEKNVGNNIIDNGEAVQNGAIAGFTTVFVLLLGFQMSTMLGSVFSEIGSFLFADLFVSLIGIPFGIIGALIGKSYIKTSKAVWIGGIAGAFLIIAFGVCSGLIFVLCPILGGC